jgi:hypothetical protein
MERSLHAMKIAARVLLAIGEHRPPDEADVEELRTLDPLMSDMPVDELACDVIQQALKRKEELRILGKLTT